MTLKKSNFSFYMTTQHCFATIFLPNPLLGEQRCDKPTFTCGLDATTLYDASQLLDGMKKLIGISKHVKIKFFSLTFKLCKEEMEKSHEIE